MTFGSHWDDFDDSVIVLMDDEEDGDLSDSRRESIRRRRQRRPRTPLPVPEVAPSIPVVSAPEVALTPPPALRPRWPWVAAAATVLIAYACWPSNAIVPARLSGWSMSGSANGGNQHFSSRDGTASLVVRRDSGRVQAEIDGTRLEAAVHPDAKRLDVVAISGYLLLFIDAHLVSSAVLPESLTQLAWNEQPGWNLAQSAVEAEEIRHQVRQSGH